MKKILSLLLLLPLFTFSQNVGISSNILFDPQYTLDVDGVTKISNYASIGVNPNSSYRLYVYNSSNNYARLGSSQYGLYARGSSSAVWGLNNTVGGHAVRAEQTSTGYSIYADGLNSRNYFQGNVGIGSLSPTSKLQVIGSASGQIESAVFGELDITDGEGIGVVGVGGYNGVQGNVFPLGNQIYYGTSGNVISTSGIGTNIGIYGRAEGGATNYAGYFLGESLGGNGYGVYGSATGTGTENIGGYFSASGATNNYALRLVDGTQGAGKVLTSDANGRASWQTAAGGGSPAWSSLTNPTGSLTLNHGTNNTTFNFANTTTTGFNMNFNSISSGNGLHLASSSTVGNDSYLLYVQRSGANSTAGRTNYGIVSTIGNTGTSPTNVAGFFQGSATNATNYAGYFTSGGAGSTNYAGYFNAANGTTNHAIYVNAGNVNIQPLKANLPVYLDENKNLTNPSVVVSTANAASTIAASAVYWISTAALTASRVVTLPTLAAGTTDGKILYVSNRDVNSNGTICLTLTAAAGNTINLASGGGSANTTASVCRRQSALLVAQGTVWYLIVKQ